MHVPGLDPVYMPFTDFIDDVYFAAKETPGVLVRYQGVLAAYKRVRRLFRRAARGAVMSVDDALKVLCYICEYMQELECGWRELCSGYGVGELVEAAGRVLPAAAGKLHQ